MVAFLYHYTSREGYEGILRDMRIRSTPSHSSCAHYGGGVYLTAVEPSAGKANIVRHNRIGTNLPVEEVIAKSSHYICLPSWELPAVKEIVSTYRRSVFLHPRDIDLNTLTYHPGPVILD